MRKPETHPSDATWGNWPQAYRDAYWWWRRKHERAGAFTSKTPWAGIEELFLNHMAARRLTGDAEGTK